MDGPGFHVDVAKVTEAAKRIADSIVDQHQFELRKLPGHAGQYGDDDLHDALAEYCNRWNDGLDILLKDAKAINETLFRVAQAYQASDQGAATRLTSDPATGAVDG